MKKYVFDGYIYARHVSGLYRYEDEILRELDRCIEKGEYTLLIPEYAERPDYFENIKVVAYGKVKGILWTQLSLARYCRANGAVSVNFCNVTPFLRPGIAVIHDIGYKVLKDHYRNLYGKASKCWHRFNYWAIAKGKYPVITVSEFSKRQIMDVYHIPPERITVIGNGWQHYERIREDGAILEKYPQIEAGRYYFALGSLEERKNFKWVMEAAKKNPSELFVIAGNSVKNAKTKIDFSALPNVIFTGYLSDGCAKWLMKNCRAFLFPSTYEGFGIPPLEAFSVGTKVICSNAASLPEVCGDAAAYIDPYDYEIDLSAPETEKKEAYYEAVLSKYSWKRSAERLLSLLREEK